MATSALGRRQIQSAMNFVFGKLPADTPAGIVFVTLFEGDPGDDGQSGIEANGLGFARVATVAADWVVATLATPSVTANLNPVSFPAAGVGGWNGGNNFDHFALFSTLSGATEADYIGRGILTTPQPVTNGQAPSFPAGALRMTGTETT